MQQITGAPRSHLTDAQVRSLLHNPAVTVRGGAELLDANLNVVRDLSGAVTAGSVKWNLYGNVHRVCSLTVEEELAWGRDLVRLFTELTYRGVTARFHLGVFTLTTPSRQVGIGAGSFDTEGHDRLHLLQREVGDTYEVPAGTEYLTAIRQAITDAGLTGVLLDGSAQGKTLPTTRTWPLLDEDNPTTWLRVVNDLLAQINYRSVWTDQDGVFRGTPYLAPADRPAEYEMDTEHVHPLPGPARTVERDVWALPTRWVFVRKNMPGDPPDAPVEGAGIWTYNLPDAHELSAVNRGLVKVRTLLYDAADQAALQALGERKVADDLRVTTRHVLDTGPFPLAGHADVFTYRDPESHAGAVKVQAETWEQDIMGGDTRWTWEQV